MSNDNLSSVKGDEIAAAAGAPAAGEEEGVGLAEEKADDLSNDERRHRTLFIGNVPMDTKAKELKRLCKKFGHVESVRIRGVFPDSPNIPKKTALLAKRLNKNVDSMLAYVVFGRSETVAEAMAKACEELNMTEFNGKHLRVTPAEVTRGPLRCSVFLGNLPFDLSEEELIQVFQEETKESGSKIVKVQVSRDRKTGIGRGVGFVTFDDDLGVRFCLNKAGSIVVKGRVVRMERAVKEKKKNTKTFKRLQKSRLNREDNSRCKSPKKLRRRPSRGISKKGFS